MTNPKIRVDTAETEAAEWHARLGARSVTTREIEDFFAWRQTPANADAYRRAELIWGETRKLAGDAEVDAALSGALARRKGRGRGIPKPVLAFAAISAAAALAFGGLSWWQAKSLFSTDVGEQRLVQLADGSTVRLDTDSRIRVSFADGRRRVDLEHGQALFDVAHDPARPFVVRAGDTSVTAVGTVFDVRRDAQGAKVILLSGVVDVATSADVRERQRLQAGQKAEVREGRAIIGLADAASGASWAEGRIVFRDTPLSEAVAEVNRYLTDKVELAPGPIGDERVTGVFKTGDRDAFVSTASEIFGLQALRQGDGGVRLSKPQK